MKKFLLLAIPVIVCFIVGFIGSRVQQPSIETWYPALVKPSLTPPNIVFPIAWGILYLLMGISIGLIISSEKSPDKRSLILIFTIQLILNALWSMLFFKMQNPALGFIDIILLDAVVIWYIVKSYRNHRISSILVIPYALWILFASYLNLFIMLHN